MDMSNYNDPHTPNIWDIVALREQYEAEKKFEYSYDDYNNWTASWYDDEIDPGFECPACFGSGLDRHEDVDCMNCWGEGRVYGNI